MFVGFVGQFLRHSAHTQCVSGEVVTAMARCKFLVNKGFSRIEFPQSKEFFLADSFLIVPAPGNILLHLLVGEGSLLHPVHVVLIVVVLLVADHRWQFGEDNRVVVFRLIGGEFNLVHELVGLGDEPLDADSVVFVLGEADGLVEGGLLVELGVPAHDVLWKIILYHIND